MGDLSGINGASGFSSFFNTGANFSDPVGKAGAADFDPSFDIQDPTYTSNDAANQCKQSGGGSTDLSTLLSQLITFLSKLLKSLTGDDGQQDDTSGAGDIQDPPPAYTADTSSPPPYTPPAGANDGSTNGPAPVSDSIKTTTQTSNSGSSAGSNGASGNFSPDVPTGLNSDTQTKDMEKNLVKAFMDKGLTQNQAVGVVASLKEESGLNTAIRQGGAYDTDPNSKADVVDQTGFGLAQWGEDRLQNLQKYADANKLPASSQAAQVGFMMQEAESMGVLDQIKNGPDDASAACATWTTNYEKAAAPNMDTRLANISQIENDIA